MSYGAQIVVEAESSDRAVSSDVSTPLFYRGHFFVVNSDKKSISKLTPDGNVVWERSLADIDSDFAKWCSDFNRLIRPDLSDEDIEADIEYMHATASPAAHRPRSPARAASTPSA